MALLISKKFLYLLTFFTFLNIALPQYTYSIEWPVQYLSQRSNTQVGESACGPTSIAMLLNYYYPNAQVDITETYHSGIEAYSYEGLAAC